MYCKIPTEYVEAFVLTKDNTPIFDFLAYLYTYV